MAVDERATAVQAAPLPWISPNAVSLFRIGLVPLIVWVMHDPGALAGVIAAVLFVIGSLSDYYDGYLARKHGIVTTLGKFLDPLADKLLVVSVLIMLVAVPIVVPRVPAWVVVLIVGRELAVTGLRSMAAGEGITLGAEELGKYKTIFQIFALTGLLVHYQYLFVDFHLAGTYFLWISLVLGLWSAIDYSARVYREVRARRIAEAGNVDRLP